MSDTSLWIIAGNKGERGDKGAKGYGLPGVTGDQGSKGNFNFRNDIFVLPWLTNCVDLTLNLNDF